MYNYNPNTMAAGNSPPMPDILGQYYGHGPSMDHLLTSSTGLLYDPITATYGRPVSPVHHQFGRRRRYSIGGLPTASAYNEYYDHSATHIDNLLNETCKSISRSSQILNQRLGLGRNISSYPAINVGCELHNHPSSTSPPYFNNENLMQLSSSFSSQPNMYFPPYDKSACISGNVYYPGSSAMAAAAAAQAVASGRIRPAFSSSHLNYPRPSMYNISSNNYNNASNLPYSTYNNNTQSQTTATPYSNMLLQQRNLMPPSLHYSNPDYYHDNNYYNQSYSSHHHNHHLHPHHLQQQLQPSSSHYHQPHSHYSHHNHHTYGGTGGGAGNFNNLPPHFTTGTGTGTGTGRQPTTSSQRHSQYQQHLLHDQYPTSTSQQYHHLQQQIQQQLQSHHTATGLLGATSVGGAAGGGVGTSGGASGPSGTMGGPHNAYDHHVHPLSKLDYCDYVGMSSKNQPSASTQTTSQQPLPQPPPETKRQVSFKFDVDTLSID